MSEGLALIPKKGAVSSRLVRITWNLIKVKVNGNS
jgi:hypothetical protein